MLVLVGCSVPYGDLIQNDDKYYYKEKPYSGKSKGVIKWEDDQLLLKGSFKDGKKDGVFEQWYSNGQLRKEEKYKVGEKNGLTTWWHGNGQLRLEWNYKDGKLISYKCWNEDGFEEECD